ncbi:substrate-binding domain-containing protein [Demequina sediminis]|uniref:substrate-binding domain-containing protein n=1 Tax=Demequina sediminis TaxID=1930058 RepID=UPI002572AFC7|nr:substrate-binding domain-containing protein [Demequina sediminis]
MDAGAPQARGLRRCRGRAVRGGRGARVDRGRGPRRRPPRPCPGAATHRARVPVGSPGGGAILAARELGIPVPQHLSITGFDGIDLPWIAPLELTTQVQDAEAKGHAMAAEVKALLAGDSPEPVVMELELRLGNTTARPPHASAT